MPRNNWIGIAKVGGFACLSFVIVIVIFWWGETLGSKSGYYEAQSQGFARQYPNDTDKRVEKCFDDLNLADAKQCTQEAITASRENERGEFDLQAQREVADWTYYVLVISAIQIPLGLLGLIALIVTIRQGQEALVKTSDGNDIARENLVTAQRAWLCAEHSIDGPFVKNGTWGTHIETLVSNVGNTPALDVNVCVKMYMQHPDLPPKDDLIKSMVELAKREAADAPRVHILPGQKVARVLPAFIEHDIWNKMRRGFIENSDATKGGMPFQFQVFVVTVTVYRTIFNRQDEWRTCARVYDLRFSAPVNRGLPPVPFTDNVASIEKHLLSLVLATDVAGLID